MQDLDATADEAPFRSLVNATFTFKHRVMIAGASALCLCCAAAVAMSDKYSAHASLLTLLGTEYTYRPLAGQSATSNGALEREQVLRTEIEILDSDDLHRALIRRIGIERLYPDYVVPPGFLKAAVRFVIGLPSMITDLIAGGSHGGKLDPVELALLEFNDAFSAVPVKAGNSIELSFTHKDAGLAAEALNTLDAMYLERRRTVFSDEQSALLEAQVAKLKEALTAADTRLSEFRLGNGASAFATRREIVLHAQGDARKEMQDAESAIAQGEARVATLRRQLSGLASEVQSGEDTDLDGRLSPLRASIDGLRAKEAELLANYRPDSVAVRSVHAQIAAREAELAARKRDLAPSGFHRARNPLRESADGDLLHAQADLDAARARRERAQSALQDIAAQARTLDENERQLDQLERQRIVAEDAYREGAKLLEQRRIIDDVEARKQASVRIVQPATVPIKPRPTRKLLVLGGVVLAIVSSAAMALLSNLARRSYLRPDEVERDLGVAVLACVPERNPSVIRDFDLVGIEAAQC